ncbi:hypothetical protein [Yoonia sp. I 8.24]|uniref:hypothetical protein n=1 Tax=Yoonia sp. I 8.24 TaxID=1537229 RepID=UPI001EDCE00A|nr:hypothetical protein [Yoonia sp. I 8.24]MCG3266462.1 hypothetical protein [Yoonia sp. I 8.24]
MLLLRSIPLSFSILWRFVLVLPFWIVAYTAMTLFFVFGTFPAMLGIPVIGFLGILVFAIVVPIMFAMISMHPYLIGIRFGLRSLGFATKNSQQRLFAGAAGYGLFETVTVGALLVVVTSVSAFVVSGQLGISAADAPDGPVGQLSTDIAMGTLTFVSLLSSLIMMAMRAALLPALANFVAGTNPKGISFSNFDGFGAGFGIMFLLMLMITGLTAATGYFVEGVVSFLDFSTVLREKLDDVIFILSGKKDAAFTLRHAVIVSGAILFAIWVFCLQCAGAALSYERRTLQAQAERAEYEAKRERDQQDIGALLRARMAKNNTRK